VILAVSGWRVIFAVNVVIGVVLAALIHRVRFGSKPQASAQKTCRSPPIGAPVRGR
jgi:MFS family permease